MLELAILAATFVFVLVVVNLFTRVLFSRRETTQNLSQLSTTNTSDEEIDSSALSVEEREYEGLLRHYYNVVRNDDNPHSIANALIKAGYFSPRAPFIYYMIRIGTAVFIFSLIAFFLFYLDVSLALAVVFGISAIGAAIAFILTNVILDYLGRQRLKLYQKTFPDFMDTLIVCLDAGLSVEASFDRVTNEFLKSDKRDFGLHLSILLFEVRGGRRLRDALSNFANRIQLDEAKSLAVLFRQSEELGASVTKTLRVFSEDMRVKRIIRAEEKANLLPLKMLIPISLFLFPMSLLIVLAPVALIVLNFFTQVTPGGTGAPPG